MKAVLRALAATVAAACDGSPPAADAGLVGGDLELPGCGYTAWSGYGATAPVWAGDAVGPDPTPHQVHLGFGDDPRKNMVITWRTADETTERTEVTVDGRVVHGVTWTYEDIERKMRRVHEVHLCGLAPDTQYTYQVAGDPQPATFRTAPDIVADPSAEIVALVLGDSRDDRAVFGGLVALAEEIAAPDVVLFTGDAVWNGSNQVQWDEFFDAAPLLRRVPIVSTIGNHEEGGGGFYAMYAMPGREQRFSFDYGAAHVAVVDDTPWQHPDNGGKGAAFLSDDLPSATVGQWRIVLHHMPLFAASERGGSEILRGYWQPIFDEHRVDLALAGHEHKYERTFPVRGDAIAAGGGTVYVVTGGAGAVLQSPVAPEWWTAASANVYHFLVLHIRRDAIEARTYDATGAEIDSFSIYR